MIQRTDEWYQARCGKITGSGVADIFKSGRGSSESVMRKNYLIEKALERVTGTPIIKRIKSDDIDRGVELEDEAVSVYEAVTGRIVESCGFIAHKSIPMFGASPDGLCEDRVIECKCLNDANHWEFINTGKISTDRMYQIWSEMACTGKTKCDYFSYNPHFPGKLNIWIKTIEISDFNSEEIEAEVKQANSQIDALVQQISSMED